MITSHCEKRLSTYLPTSPSITTHTHLDLSPTRCPLLLLLNPPNRCHGDRFNCTARPAQSMGELAIVEGMADNWDARAGNICFQPNCHKRMDQHFSRPALASTTPINYAPTAHSCCGLPGIGNIWPDFGSKLPEHGNKLASSGAHWPMSVKAVPKLVTIGANSTEFERCRRHVGQSRPGFGQMRAVSA